MKDLDVTITAVRRPEVFFLTAESFRKNLFAGNFRTRAILNIDPLGGSIADGDEVERIARANFDEVLVRKTQTGSFGDAVRWTWSNARTPWILHLEDDWLLVRKIDIAALNAEMEEPGVIAVRFYLKRNRRSIYRRRISLNPSFMKLEVLQRMLADFNPELDPEKQLPELPEKEKVRVHGRARAPQIVLDMGKNWRGAIGVDKTLEAGIVSKFSQRNDNLLKRAFLGMKQFIFLQRCRLIKALSGLRRRI